MSTDPSEALVTEVFTNTSITHYPGFSPSSLVMNIVTSPVWQVPSRYTHDVHIIGSQAGVEVIHNLYTDSRRSRIFSQSNDCSFFIVGVPVSQVYNV